MGVHFNLIQRGTIRKNDSYLKLMSCDSSALVDGDYMGSAEFEFGAIPAAYTRIKYNFAKYGMHDTGIYTVQGKKLFIFCQNEHYDEILEDLKEYHRNPYSMKEWTNFNEHFEFAPKSLSDMSVRHRDYNLQTDFWWCIDRNGRPMSRTNGDWMAFVLSKKDEYIKDWFEKILAEGARSFNLMPEEEKELQYYEATTGFY